MPPLIDAFIEWWYNALENQDPQPHPLENTDNLYTINVYDINMSSNLKITSYIIARSSDSISPAVNFIKHSFLVKTHMLPEVKISLKTLEFYHRIRLQKASYSAKAFAKVICDFYLVGKVHWYYSMCSLTSSQMLYWSTMATLVADTYEQYLLIIWAIDKHVQKSLGWDASD